MKSILYFAPLFRQVRGPMLLTLVLSLLTLAMGIALLGLSGWFLTAAGLSAAGAAFNLFGPSAGVRGLSFTRILSRYGEKLAGHDATLRLLSDLRRWLFARLFPLVPLDRQLGRADLVSRLLVDVEALDTMFLVALGPISTAVLTAIGMTALLAWLLPAAAWVYGPAFLAAALLVPLGLIAMSRNAGSEAIAASGQLRETLLDTLDGHVDLILFGAVEEATLRVSAASARLARARRTLGRLGAIASASVQALAGLALIGTLIAGAGALQAGRIDGPLFVGLLLAVMASFEAGAMLVRSATRLAGAVAAAERLQNLAESLPSITATTDSLALPAGGQVGFSHVSFGYGDGPAVIDDFSLSVAAGECVAIVGPSGSGKSTIAQLMLRLLEPRAGAITVNGCDIRSVRPEILHARITLMMQDAPVFLETIRANLTLARPDAADGELWDILGAVGLDGFVRSLPYALDTVVGEAGRTLSAGQARRLCLARTLLSGADIVVLDEPTAGLDATAEADFLRDLPRLAAGRTMIVITHADVPPQFDRIVDLTARGIGRRAEIVAFTGPRQLQPV